MPQYTFANAKIREAKIAYKNSTVAPLFSFRFPWQPPLPPPTCHINVVPVHLSFNSLYSVQRLKGNILLSKVLYHRKSFSQQREFSLFFLLLCVQLFGLLLLLLLPDAPASVKSYENNIWLSS